MNHTLAYVMLFVSVLFSILVLVHIILLLIKHGTVVVPEVSCYLASLVLLLSSLWLPPYHQTPFPYGSNVALAIASLAVLYLPTTLHWIATRGKPLQHPANALAAPSPPGEGHRNAIKIIAAPIGEAPLPIREAWIGLVLPLAMQNQQRAITLGVLSHPKTRLGLWLRLRRTLPNILTAYLVDSATAIDILARTHPDAAQWWRDNVPHFVVPGRSFAFNADACQEVPEAVWPPPPVVPDTPPIGER